MTVTTPQSAYSYAFGDEPLPGYRLIAPLGRGGFGEVWKCVAPGGLHKAIKFVHEDADARPGRPDGLEQEYEAFRRVKDIRHPFLLTLERVELIGGELIQVMELADQSLAQRYDDCRKAGQPGIPRDELLAYMVDAAEALDVLGREHGLQHLDVKPANLFLVGGHVKVGDYGLVSRHVSATTPRQLVSGYTPRYVAPEVLDGVVDSRTDQYPLALLYQELLTGTFPYPGPSTRALLIQHKTAEPDLTPLPPTDRPTVARGLAKNPADRFPTCLEFVRALLHGPSPPNTLRNTALVMSSAVFRSVASAGEPAEATLRTPAAGSRTGPISQLLTARPADELARTCPGFRTTTEHESGHRGRRLTATDPTGRTVRVQLLRLDGGVTTELELVTAAVARPHPALWQEVYASHPRMVGFVTPGGPIPLNEWLRARRGRNEPVPGLAEVIALLDPLAAALDDLHEQLGFPHALLSSETVLVEKGRTGMTGYGIGELLRLSSENTDWLRHDPYIAPEVAVGRPHPASDQLSLAWVLLELIAAWTPPGRSDRTVPGRINWNLMAEPVRLAVRTALNPNPQQRYQSCREFLAAIRPATSDEVVLDDIRMIETVARLTDPTAPRGDKPPPDQWVEYILRAAAGSGQTESGGRPVVLPDGRVAARFPIGWLPGLRDLKTAAFKDQFRYTVIPLAPDTLLLKPVGEKSEPVELVVEWPVRAKAGMAEVSVTGRWMGGISPHRGVPLVTAMIDQFRRVVQNTDDRRKAPRVRTGLPVEVYPIGDDLQVGRPLTGQCRDVSATGFAAVLPAAVDSTHAFVRFPGVDGADGCAVLAHVVRTQPGPGPGTVLTGWRFVHAGNGK